MMIVKKYSAYLVMLLMVLGIIGNNVLVAQQRTFMERAVDEAARKAEEIAANQRRSAENRRQRFLHLDQMGAANPNHHLHAEYKEAERKRGRAEQREDMIDNFELEVGRALVGIATNYHNAETEKIKIEAERQTKVEAAYAGALAAQEGITARSNTMWSKLTDRKNIVLWSLALITIPVTIYACKLGLDYANSKWGMPNLVKESSRKSLKQVIMAWISGKKPIKVNLDDVVLAPDIDVEAKAIAERTKKKHAYGAPYQNLLLFGPPGTGKTEFAKTLAYYSDMDYAIIDGGSFGQFKKGSRGVAEINKLFDWAEKSSRDLLIFIDEADAFAPDRNTITDADERNILNTFIARTGAPSTKVMIVFATNHREALDAAVRSRLGKPMYFGLPEAPERAKILRKKIEKFIENFIGRHEKKKTAIKLSCEPEVISDAFLKQIANTMKGFSGRDIEKAVIDMQAETIETNERMLTKNIVQKITLDWVDKIAADQKITEAQNEAQKKKSRINALG